MIGRALAAAVLLGAIAAGCGGEPFEHALPASPLLGAEWPSVFPSKAAGDAVAVSEDDAGAGDAPAADGVRGRMLVEARRWLGDAASRPDYGYGARDLDEILAVAAPTVDWSADAGLAALVALARERGAYRTGADPRPGDVALFHNELDANGNGAFDDWLTGCAIVTGAEDGRLTAVTRTGHAPRAIVAWPDGPAVERLGDDKANSFLRIPTRADPKDARYLAGDLYAGYIDVDALAAATGGR